jgi:hypothetical protein
MSERYLDISEKRFRVESEIEALATLKGRQLSHSQKDNLWKENLCDLPETTRKSSRFKELSVALKSMNAY